MAVTVDRVAPVAHLPLVLGVLRKLEIATLIYSMIPPHPDQVVSAGRAVEALVLSILMAITPSIKSDVVSMSAAC